MNLCVIVHCPLTRASLHLGAMDFVRTAAQQGHTITAVFFHGDAVGASLATPSEEASVHRAWCDLLQQVQVEGTCCIAVAQARGLDAQMRAPFVTAGLGQLVVGSARAERVITFA